MVGVKQVLSPFFDERPAGVVPDLIVLHGISLPPGEFGGPWIARLFTGQSAGGRASRISRTRGFARLGASAATPRWRGRCSSFRSTTAPGMPAIPRGRAARPATTIRSASNAKAPTMLPYEAAQYADAARASADVVSGATRRSHASASWVTATSRPAARPIRGRLSTGRSYVDSRSSEVSMPGNYRSSCFALFAASALGPAPAKARPVVHALRRGCEWVPRDPQHRPRRYPGHGVHRGQRRITVRVMSGRAEKLYKTAEPAWRQPTTCARIQNSPAGYSRRLPDGLTTCRDRGARALRSHVHGAPARAPPRTEGPTGGSGTSALRY